MKTDYRIVVEESLSLEGFKCQNYSMMEVIYDSRNKIIGAFELGHILSMNNVDSLPKLKHEVDGFMKAFKKPFIKFDQKTGKWKVFKKNK